MTVRVVVVSVLVVAMEEEEEDLFLHLQKGVDFHRSLFGDTTLQA